MIFCIEEEVLVFVNLVLVGLVGYVFISDIVCILWMGQKLEIGMIGVNLGVFFNVVVLFGGVKEFGLGCEGFYQGIEEFLEMIYVVFLV